MLKKLGSIVITWILLFSFASVKAEEWTNGDTGYKVYIDDAADLLTQQEEEKLMNEMQYLTMYGGCAFITVNENTSGARAYAEDTSYNLFNNESSVLFLIDMDNRMIWMSTTGDIYKTVTSSYCNTITDNVYKLATKGEYYRCASDAFVQTAQLLDGQAIAEPMKHISNVFLALIFSIVMNFMIVMIFSGKMKVSTKEIMKGVEQKLTIRNINVNYSHTEKRYDPPSDSSSGSSSGGGGGGGGFSGGGGGHSF